MFHHCETSLFTTRTEKAKSRVRGEAQARLNEDKARNSYERGRELPVMERDDG